MSDEVEAAIQRTVADIDPSVATWIATIEEVQARTQATTQADDAGDDPGEPVYAETDLDWLADLYADREEQFMRGEN